MNRIPEEHFLKENGYLVIYPVGKSMLPLIREAQDAVVLSPPEQIKVGDVVWYRRKNGENVLHRVMAMDHQGVSMCGDNQLYVETHIAERQILGVMQGLYRGRRYIRVDGLFYRLYKLLWKNMLVRRVFLKLLRMVGKV